MIPDIHRILTENDCGVIIPNTAAGAWANGICQALARKDVLRENASKAARRYIWEDLERETLHAAFSHAGSITFIGLNNLAKNNRTMRIAASLVAMGVVVKVACPLDWDDVMPDGVVLIVTSKVLGWGDGSKMFSLARKR